MTETLAVARVVRLIQADTITEPLRKRVLDLAYDRKWDRLTELMQCSWCLSVWVAAGLGVLRLAAPRLHAEIVTGLACSYAAAIAIEASTMLASKIE